MESSQPHSQQQIDLTDLDTAVATAVSILTPVIVLKFGNFLPNDIKQYLYTVLTQIKANNYFSVLLAPDLKTISSNVATNNASVDFALYISLSKLIP